MSETGSDMSCLSQRKFLLSLPTKDWLLLYWCYLSPLQSAEELLLM